MNEADAISAAARGDRIAFRQLVLTHSAPMYGLAFRLVGDSSTADDIVQDAFIKAFKKLSGFNRQASFRTWLHRITVNTAMDHLRREQRRRSHEDDETDIDLQAAVSHCPAEQRDLALHTQRALSELSELERTALILRHYEGHSLKEISSILETNTNACKQAIFRAVRKMRCALEPMVKA